MKNTWITIAAVAIGNILVTGVASAQEKDQAQTDEESQSLRPATHAVELTIGTGYAQGFGKFSSGQPSLTDVGVAGGTLQGGVGYRIIPQLTVGAYGSWAMFGRGDQADPTGHVYSSTAGVQADWHFLPGGHQFDPWLSLGSGWRGYWTTADHGTTTMHGLELAKLQIGVDYRIDKSISISPVFGADLSTFLVQSTPTANEFHDISESRVNTFLFAGVQGRFDIPTGSDFSSHVALR